MQYHTVRYTGTNLLSSSSVISGFCRNVDEIYAVLGYYAASSGKGLLLNAV
jgi:hypothetical protein